MSVRRKRRARSRSVGRWLALGALAAASAVLYYHPLTSYLDKRAEVAVRSAEVEALQRERASLERRLESQRSEATIVREARKLAYVKPGEQLFVVKGIAEWKRARAPDGAGATIEDDG